jgi:hypothetical protein
MTAILFPVVLNTNRDGIVVARPLQVCAPLPLAMSESETSPQTNFEKRAQFAGGLDIAVIDCVQCNALPWFAAIYRLRRRGSGRQHPAEFTDCLFEIRGCRHRPAPRSETLCLIRAKAMPMPLAMDSAVKPFAR